MLRAVAFPEQQAQTLGRVLRGDPDDPSVDRPHAGARDDEHLRLGTVPLGVEPVIVGAQVAVPVVGLPGQGDVREVAEVLAHRAAPVLLPAGLDSSQARKARSS